MKLQVTKAPKVALCRKCRGTGIWRHADDGGVTLAEPRPQCGGSGRVTVSAVVEYDIRPYKRKEQ